MTFTFLAANTTITVVLSVIALLVLLVLAFFLFSFFNLYIQAWSSGAYISPVNLIMMRLRSINPKLITMAYIQSRRAHLEEITVDKLETHYLSGGDVINVVNALIAANNAGIKLDYKKACAIDLAGRDVFEAVKMSVMPKVIDCPDPAFGRTTIDAVAKDGIQLRVQARVTVKASIEKLIGVY